MTLAALQTFERSNLTKRRLGALPPACSFRAGNPEIDTLIMGTTSTAIGAFRCPVDHPAFEDSGPIPDPLFVFPRTSVWIQHDGARAFYSDPSLVTMYNRGQRYTRRASSVEGDESDWFALSDDVAREIVASADAAASDAERPFGRSRTRSTVAMYVRQRTLTEQARRGEVTTLELDERIFEIAADVLAPDRTGARRPGATRSRHRRSEIVDAAREMLARDVTDQVSLGAMAQTLGTSPFHLCRVFRAETGETLRSYRNGLRCRLALADLATDASNIAAIAHRYGFASHAHFVRVARQYTGKPPGALRRALTGA